MSQAVLGWGTLFQTESLDSPNVWITVAEVMNITPPTLSRDSIDTSSGNAPDEWRTAIPGMPGAAVVSMDFNFIVSGHSPDTYDYYSDLKLELADRTIRSRRLVFPNGEIMEFDAFLSELSSEQSADAQLKAKAVFTVSGEVGAIT